MRQETHLLSTKLITQADAIIYFLQKLDIDMINDILDDHRTYQDFEKYIFIYKLGNALSEFIESGDTFLNLYSGVCISKICNYKCSGFSFIGNNSKNYIDLIIDIKEGVVHDMYECSKFKHLETGFEKNNRILIDKFEIPDFPPF